jgi:NAD(P)-dependent dehydrogenase (short-subunit alcohol dehydrogenase family)
MTTSYHLSVDGVELQMAVNHLAPFALTHLLKPLLLAAPHGRVVFTSSMAHAFAKAPSGSWFDVAADPYRPFGVYARSKLANLIFAQELGRRWNDTQLSIQAFHPGWVRTGFGSSGGPQKGGLMAWASALALPPQKGADTGVFLVDELKAAPASGLYWVKRKPRNAARSAAPQAGAALWTESEALVSKVLGG